MIGETLRTGKNYKSKLGLSPLREAATNRVHLHGELKSCTLAISTCFLFLSLGRFLSAQENPQPLTPSEAYKAALAPVTATRSQPNDLTEADKFALGIGIVQASRDCLALSSNVSSLAGNTSELYALGQLCVFGQQFESARAVLVNYLALPQPPQREEALLLLVRAYIGMKEAWSAEPQVDSLLRDYPYDARIHAAIDQVLDGMEGLGPEDNPTALKLCATQNAVTLPLLNAGKALEAKEGSASAALLFSDAVRCASLALIAHKPDNLADLEQIPQLPAWSGTADLAPMQSALARQQMVGKASPISSLHGLVLGPSTLVPKAVSLMHGAVLLVPFTLWSPSAPEMVRDLVKFLPSQSIYAITSWHMSTGRDDVRSNDVLAALRSFQKSFPAKVSLLVVPNTVLNTLQSDVFPAAILMRDGTVLANLPLNSEGAERLILNASGSNDETYKRTER